MCRETAKIFQGLVSRKFPANIQARAFNKLTAIHASKTIDDLKAPPSNHLKKLTGDREGQFSIRINNKYRICFKWQRDDAIDVEIVNYH